MHFNPVKKILIVLGAVGIVALSLFSPLRGQDSSSGSVAGLLQQILQKVNDLPAFIDDWRHTDDSDASAKMQANFTQLGQLLPQNLDTQISLQGKLNQYLVGNDGKNIYSLNGGGAPEAKLPSSKNLPYGNDLVYSSLLDQPLYAKDSRENVDFAMNYILNASGANIYHKIPGGGWSGPEDSQRRYQSFYNTVMAATSFNNYILSQSYADKNQFNTLQKTLIQQASDPAEWFVKVGSEKIGFVLRQLLMYQSQVFVLLTQMVQLQKQMVTAQAMNTATIIATNQLTEASMAAYARGEQPVL